MIDSRHSTLLGLFALATAWSCASARPPEPPPPLAAEEPEGGSSPAAVVAVSTAVPARAVRPPAPPAPWIAPAVRLLPADPREGSAIGVFLETLPGSREPQAVDGALGDLPIRFARVPGGLYGLGALPIGSAGTQPLSLRYRIALDSVEERLLPVRVAGRRYASASLRVGGGASSPTVLERLERERRLIRETVEEATPEWLAVSGFEWPRTDRHTSPFGQRRLFNGQLRSRHIGLDIAGRPGEPVRAAGAGRVALVGDFLLQGRAVYVDHGLGAYTAYLHLSRIDVEQGDFVERGQLIGRVGATGRVTGPHLHWSLYVAGVGLDPESAFGLVEPAAGVPAVEAETGP